MRRLHSLVANAAAVLTSLVLFNPARAAEPAPANNPEVDALVEKLGDADWKARDRAAEELGALGEKAEPSLCKRLAEAKDPEERSRIEGLLASIERSRKEGPALVTIRRKAAKPKEVFDELAKQAGVGFAAGTDNVLDAAANQSLDVDFDRVPLWQALLELTGRSGLAFHAVEDGKIQLQAAEEGTVPAPAAAAGPFLVTLNHVEMNVRKGRAFGGRRPMNVQNNAFQHPPCKLYLFAWAEPRTEPLMWFVDSVAECVTDAGKTATGAGGRPPFGGSQVNSRNEMQFTLDLPPDAGRSIARLKLNARFVLRKGTQKLEIPDVLNVRNSQHVVAGFPVTIAHVNKVVDGQYAFEIVARREGKPQADWEVFRSLIDRYGCRLVDAEGNALNSRGGGGSFGPDEVRLTRSLTCESRDGKKVGEPVKLVWEYPAEIEQVRVALEFKDVPLP